MDIDDVSRAYKDGKTYSADVLTSTDQVIPTVVDDRLDVWQQVTGAYNIGIFHWRSTVSLKKLAEEWKELLLAEEKIWDQNGFNDIVRRKLGPSVDDGSGLVYAYDGNLKLGLLPASIFCSGHTDFVQQFKLEPYAVHTTFQYAGTTGKRHRLREAMLFYDPPVIIPQEVSCLLSLLFQRACCWMGSIMLNHTSLLLITR